MGNKSAQDAINDVSSFAPHLIPPRAPMKKYMINYFNTTTKMFLILQKIRYLTVAMFIQHLIIVHSNSMSFKLN